jgi:hypothetical protein
MAYSCSIVRTSPQERHRKVCNSGNAATLGVVRASIIGFPQVGHGCGGSSSSFLDINVHAPNSWASTRYLGEDEFYWHLHSRRY